MKNLKLDITKVAEYSRKLGINQTIFWSSLGVTQSGGSRYESGENISKPVALPLYLRSTGRLSESDLKVAAALIKKRTKPISSF